MKSLISIVGPTAVGKSKLALQLARRYGCPILSCDARQMYQGLNIGTAKPSPSELEEITHLFIDSLSPTDTYNAGKFEEEANQLIKQHFEQHDILLTAGGSTLYMHALWYGIDEMPPISAEVREQLQQKFKQEGLASLQAELREVDAETWARIDQQNPARIIRALEVYHSSGQPISTFRKNTLPTPPQSYNLIAIGLYDERERLYERINQRVDKMMEEGLLEEVKQLLAQEISPETQSLRSIGYQELVAYLQGEYPLEEALRLIKRNSRRYAKRQLTWFRKDPNIKWFEAGDVEAVNAFLSEKL